MGSLDENDVLGYAGIPVNVNGQLPDFLYSIGAAGGVFLPPGRYYVSVDSGRDLFTGRSLAGRYTLRSWVNDVRPPTVRVITKTLSSGRPTIVAKITDAKSGVDPHSLQLFFGPAARQSTVGAHALRSGRRGSPPSRFRARRSRSGPGRSSCRSSHPTTRSRRTSTRSPTARSRTRASRGSAPRPCRGRRSRGSRPRRAGASPRGSACSWSRTTTCRSRPSASSTATAQIGRVRKNVAGLYEMTWRTSGKRKGAHVLTAVASDVRGREAEATQTVRICK